MINVPTIVVHHLHKRAMVREFIKLAKPISATIQYSGKYPTWLLKNSDERGKTVAKIIDASRSPEVHDMISEEFNKSIAKPATDNPGKPDTPRKPIAKRKTS